MEIPTNSALANKHILVGVSGSIAAYKAAELVRLYKTAGARVRVVMSEGAKAFITPLSMQALSGEPVHHDLLDESAEAAMGHIQLARWADLMVVAPASANMLARLAHGRADDLLSAVCLATSAPLLVAPAMNQQMWANAATQENIERIKQRGIEVLGPGEGDQACGESGPGRMLEAVEIFQASAARFQTGLLAGVHVMVTAGPTREPLDPVRYLSNRSSGKMGYAIARAIVQAGGRCTLISGPSVLPPPDDVELVKVQTALQMHGQAMKHAAQADVFIAAAAVSDYRPQQQATQKIKKDQDSLNLSLVKNPDIVSDVKAQYPQLFVVGFAAETRDVEHYARDKLKRKNLDMICANDVSQVGLGFDSDQNRLLVFGKDGKGDQVLDIASKSVLATQLLALIQQRLSKP